MRFEVLGPMRITGHDGTRPVTGVRQRILLGALLAHAGQPMPAERLAEIVWDGALPDRAVATLRTYMTRLRQDLGPDAASHILTRDRGYLAEVGPDELDALAFEALCRAAGSSVRAADWAGASEHAARALALWRGAPLADVPSQALRDIWLPRLDQQRVQVTEWRIEAELHMGRHEHLVPLLRQMTADHPLHERFHAQLMHALARCGRQAEALAAYHDARDVLVEELGVEPGPELRNLHKRLLADDGVPAAPTAAPCQMPTAAGHFIGRHDEMNLVTGPHGPSRQAGADAPGGTVVISAIDGMAGIGKTALAVHAARRLAGRFPDGQLFIDLRGHTKGYPPREPGEALGSLLRTLGVPAAQVPAQTEECAALYRQRLASTRTLILLDNALDEAQVRPLLPAAPGCLVLITSRRKLKGLHDAHVVALDVLSQEDALALLRAVIAPAHADDPDLAEIAGLCGRLPLALRIAGALLRHRPAWTPRHLAGLLRDARGRLAALTDGDHDLHAVFDLSYTRLSERQRSLFRRVALVPGPESDAFAAAALLDVDPATATGLLEDLVDHNLLIEHAPGRYRLHDLIRAYARTLPDSDLQPGRDTALDRLLRYYAHTAQSASALISCYPRPAPDGPAPAHVPALTSPEIAQAWLRAERENLEAAYHHARGLALDDHAIALAAGLAQILCEDGPFASALALHSAAADTAERRGRRAAHATALINLGVARRLTGDLPGATDAASQALDIYQKLGHRNGEAAALNDLGILSVLAGDLAGADDTYTLALKIYRETGHLLGEATVLGDLGVARRLTGDLPGATDAASQALDIYQKLGHRNGEASALSELGIVWALTGDHEKSGDALRRVLEIYRALGHRAGEATALDNLGCLQRITGDLPAAAETLSGALEIFRVLGHRPGEAWTLADLGMVRQLAGDLPGASDAFRRALEIYEHLGTAPDIERVRGLLADLTAPMSPRVP